jgi:hypothetical protein
VVRKIVAADHASSVRAIQGMNRGLCNSPGKRADQKFADKCALSEWACQLFLSMCSTRTRLGMICGSD